MSAEKTELYDYLWAMVVLSSGGDVPVAVELSYRSTDPFAVRFVFHLFDEDVTWFVARDLLAEAFHTTVGEGDIRAWTETVEDGQDFAMELGSPDMNVRIDFDAEQIAAFLRATEEIIPVGDEPSSSVTTGFEDLLPQ